MALLFKYTATFVCSFLFRLVSNITFDLSSLNFILLSHAQLAILDISILALFSTSPIDSARIITSKSSANTMTRVCFLYWRLSTVSYWMFHSPGPQDAPYGQPRVMAFSTLELFSVMYVCVCVYVCMCVCVFVCMYVCVFLKCFINKHVPLQNSNTTC